MMLQNLENAEISIKNVKLSPKIKYFNIFVLFTELQRPLHCKYIRIL